LTKWTRVWVEYDIDICLHDYNEQKHKTKMAMINLSQCSGTTDARGKEKEAAYSSQRAVNFSSLHDITQQKRSLQNFM
jgi:hypothetical protein